MLTCDNSLCVNKLKECPCLHNRVFSRRHSLLYNDETVVWTLTFISFMYNMYKMVK